jgi:predicted ATPase/DNA-binding winged helix-turn-helix (wHTH) protein
MHLSSEEAHALTPPPAARDIAFGPFRLAPAERRLQHDGNPVQIGSRALDILIALVQSAGNVVEKRTLLARVWPGIVVEESSLRAHVAGLRKVLGDGVGEARYIANIPGRGYCFVAPIVPVVSVVPAVTSTVPEHAQRNTEVTGKSSTVAQLPPPLARMVGRDATVVALAERLHTQRFLSLVGPGGIGKTTTAISVANQVIRHGKTRAAFIDLGFVQDRSLVLATIASGLGLRLDGTDFTALVLAALKEEPTLLILDSCEHVIDIVAGLCERIFVESPSSTIIVTTREPLRVEGESVFRLQPLALPPEDVQFSAADTASYAAVEMFLERAMAAGLESAPDTDMPMIARLCRQLDGLPLAIELAAARASSFGISGLAKLLDQQFGLHWQGRRTAHPRHQTMHAVLDWSYRLLTDQERSILQQLSVFRGLFSFADALAVLLDSRTQEGDLIDALDALVAKSLISPHFERHQMQYRLLDSTRAYAAGRLAESDSLAETRRRHALWICDELERQVAPNLIAFHGKPHNTLAAQLGDIRSALDWAFSNVGNPEIATRLAAVSSHAFLSMSLLVECGKWARDGLQSASAGYGNTRLEMTLLASLAVSLMFTSASSGEIKEVIHRGLALAVDIDDVHHQLWLLAGLHLLEVRLGDVDAVFAVAQEAQAVGTASGDETAKLLSAWLLGMSHHLAGRQDEALRYCNPQAGVEKPASSFQLFGFDQRIRALIVRNRALWLAGFSDQALTLARDAIEEGLQSASPVGHCLALIYSTTLYFWAGDLETANATIDVLLERSQRHGLSHYCKVGACLQGELWVRQGRVEAGIARLAEQLVHLRHEQHEVLVWGFNLALAEGYALAGRLDEANRLLDDALAAAGTDRFDLPELLRMKAEMSIRANPETVEQATTLLWQAVDIATRQAAQGWVLRCATSLAEISGGRDADQRVKDLLATTVSRIQNGHSTADLRRANFVLSNLHKGTAAAAAAA